MVLVDDILFACVYYNPFKNHPTTVGVAVTGPMKGFIRWPDVVTITGMDLFKNHPTVAVVATSPLLSIGWVNSAIL